MQKSLDKRIVRLIHRRENEMTQTAKLTDLLDATRLKFKNPTTLNAIKGIKYLDIMDESDRYMRSTRVSHDLSNRLHAVPGAIIPTDDYV